MTSAVDKVRKSVAPFVKLDSWDDSDCLDDDELYLTRERFDKWLENPTMLNLLDEMEFSVVEIPLAS